MKILQPPSWARPKGFSNGIAVKGGTTVYIAGQVGWTGAGIWEAKDFAGQFRQTLRNILDVLAEAGGGPEHLVKLTWYVIDKAEQKLVFDRNNDLISHTYPDGRELRRTTREELAKVWGVRLRD